MRPGDTLPSGTPVHWREPTPDATRSRLPDLLSRSTQVLQGEAESEAIVKTSVAELSEPEALDIERTMDDLTPRVLPAEWRQFEGFANMRAFISRDGLKVLAEVENIDGAKWLHVSCSRAKKLPSWFDLRRVKDLFVGKKRKAVQVLPPEDEYVNLNPYVLHLYAPIDRDPLPDFRMDGAI